ncbi:uncharacterized protein LOC116022740 [Ipomoea triloba]|uniref:uncharacterized protein LOC116022740 n=1 Tax=Ipomoea triloba TaxID=35885 RepID=UPI00125D5D3A|nr:uncharacterized protein LOC116022740 [Ipomoea triloba]
MTFSHNEDPSNPSKRCKFLPSTLKDAFANCRNFRGKLSGTRPEDGGATSDEEEDDEDEVFVSAVISKYMESKIKRKTSITWDKFGWAFSPAAGDLFTTAKAAPAPAEEEEDEFMSVGTHLSRCSSAGSLEAFFSAKTTSCLSRCSSLGRIEFPEYRRRSSIILEFSHCEGWPFGLCRKAVLLPPLPKSPSDSWLWRNKTTGRPSSFKMH